ncbi:MAG: inosine/xanthosine triphosphatase [Candidatus Hodarchaeota archaeon]
MKIAVGSTNPVKFQAVENAFSHYFPAIEVISIKVDSDVPIQPYNEEIKKGAENRARKALKVTNAEYSVGLEGGIIELYETAYIAGYCAIMNQNLECHGSWGSFWECPPLVLKQLKSKKKELGIVIDELSKRTNTKQAEGAIGIFSKGVILRELVTRHAVIYALIPFLNEKFYRIS